MNNNWIMLLFENILSGVQNWYLLKVFTIIVAYAFHTENSLNL